MLRIKNELLQTLAAELESRLAGTGARAAFELPKAAEHGDFASTAAMQLAKPLRQNPRVLAQDLCDALGRTVPFQTWVNKLEVAGPGYINITLKSSAKQQIVSEVLAAGTRFGVQPSNGLRMMVEFVSANPTGPLHLGHARQAALGDAICNLYAAQGWAVHREFYYNDAGGQIEVLAKSVQLRARGIGPGDAGWPNEAGANIYNGAYIADIAADYLAKGTVTADDRSTTASGDVEDLVNLRLFAVAYLRHEQDLDLQTFALRFDQYYLESSLYTSARVEAAVEALRASGKVYEHDGALWLRTTDYGDDKDRVMRKGDGSYTYFVPDVAYHLGKWERGFTKVLNIQGTDHHGTITRVRAGLQAASAARGLGIPKGYPDYLLHTMVRVMRDGKEVKASKRAGDYVTLRDLVEWTSRDAVRFFLLSRKADTEYVFDVDLALAHNNENPVFYVQYAHARICSVLAAWGGDALTLPGADLSSLQSPQALTLMTQLARYPEMLSSAARDFAPHDVCFYLRELAASYHSYNDSERILVYDEAVKRARLALICATALVLHNGLAVLGVSAPVRMTK